MQTTTKLKIINVLFDQATMRIDVLLMCSWLISTSLYAKPISVTIFTDDSYPPYSYAENGQAMGIYPDIVRSADTLMEEFEIVLQPTPWRRGLKLLEAGRIFALLPLIITPTSALTSNLIQILSSMKRWSCFAKTNG